MQRLVCSYFFFCLCVVAILGCGDKESISQNNPVSPVPSNPPTSEFAFSNARVSGKILGADWSPKNISVFVRTLGGVPKVLFRFDNSLEAPCLFVGPSDPQLDYRYVLVGVAKNLETKLYTTNITLGNSTYPVSDNSVEGHLLIESITDHEVTGKIEASIDSANHINGTFVGIRCQN